MKKLLKTQLLLLSHFNRVQLCATPEMAAHQAPQSLEFSRQEHWGGLPFPSPMHESETWKWSHSVVSDSSRPHGLQPTRQEYWSGVPLPSPVGLHRTVQFSFFSVTGWGIGLVHVILSGLPWKWTEIILLFLRLHPSTAFQTLLLTMMATPFLLRDSCPQWWI